MDKFKKDCFYSGVKGSRIFYVNRDNQDGTYETTELNHKGEYILKVREFDSKAKLLTFTQIAPYLKLQAVRRGFERKKLVFKNNALYSKTGVKIWAFGRWNKNVISIKEAEERLTGITII